MGDWAVVSYPVTLDVNCICHFYLLMAEQVKYCDSDMCNHKRRGKSQNIHQQKWRLMAETDKSALMFTEEFFEGMIKKTL